MKYKEINVSSAIKKITRKDDLFNGDYTIDSYQNCEFSCSYCDSSIEKTVYIKKNIIELLDKELKKIPRSNFIIGSVHDPYQKIEKKEKLSREIIRLIKKNNHTCDVVTKSDLVLRDIDLLKDIKKSAVTLTITTFEEKLRKIFEKNVISATDRFKVIKRLREKDIDSGIAVIPIIPFLTEDELEKIVRCSKNINSKYYLYRYLELKGDQKELFLKIIKDNFKDKYDKFKNLYKYSILPDENYIKKTDLKIKKFFEKNRINF